MKLNRFLCLIKHKWSYFGIFNMERKCKRCGKWQSYCFNNIKKGIGPFGWWR